MEQSKTKCYGYVRVSTDNQEESREVQEKRIREYCTFQNLELVELLVDENVSGFKCLYKRPAGASLEILNEVKNIIAIKPDRLFRNVKDALMVIDDWNNKDVALHLVDVGGVSLSTKTAIGRLMFTTIIAFAEFERGITGERTKAVLNNKKSTGKAYCGSILGFDNIDGKMVPNTEELSIVNLIKEFATEMSPGKIADELNFLGHRAKKGGKFFPSTIQNILKNPIYNQ